MKKDYITFLYDEIYSPLSKTRKTTFIYTATSSAVHEKSMYEIGKLDSFNNLHITNSSWWDTIAVMVAFAVVLSVLLITISFFLAVKKPDAEKLSPYECGFEPFGHSRQKFDIRYYLVSLLFILFDLEVVYLFPLIAVDEYVIKNGGFIIAIIFLAILAIGIIYEFSKKALESV
jgi:NADH-quinone oxidoreductase subunit A